VICPCKTHEPLLTTDAATTHKCVCGHAYLDHLGEDGCTFIFAEPRDLDMRQLDTLTDADRGSVWRCPAFTVAWIDGEWCRLDRREWIPLQHMPEGPFYEIENPNFADYRDRPEDRGILLGLLGPDRG